MSLAKENVAKLIKADRMGFDEYILFLRKL
jgi:hypothetical protein